MHTNNAANFALKVHFILKNVLQTTIKPNFTCNQLVGEPKSRILQNDKKIAPDFDMAEFLYIGSLISA